MCEFVKGFYQFVEMWRKTKKTKRDDEGEIEAEKYFQQLRLQSFVNNYLLEEKLWN